VAVEMELQYVMVNSYIWLMGMFYLPTHNDPNSSEYKLKDEDYYILNELVSIDDRIEKNDEVTGRGKGEEVIEGNEDQMVMEEKRVEDLDDKNDKEKSNLD